MTFEVAAGSLQLAFTVGIKLAFLHRLGNRWGNEC